jgi:hypothetical protein
VQIDRQNKVAYDELDAQQEQMEAELRTLRKEILKFESNYRNEKEHRERILFVLKTKIESGK